jgi:glycerol-3-phosphate dehydrogenase
VRDLETGTEHEVRGTFVLDAARPRSRGLLEAGDAAGPGAPGPPPGEGWLEALNLVYAGPWPLRERLGVGARSRGRYLFLVPWRDRILAGTDYRPAGEAGGGAAVDSFRTELEQAFPWAGLAARDVTLVHRGLVPGAAGPEGLATTPRVVDHAAEGGPLGLLSVEGVKYTTARAVTERLVDLVASRLGRPEARRSPDRRSPAPDPLEWARPLEGSLAERTRLAVRDEMARSLCDAVLRRLDLGTGGPPAGPEAEEVAGAMARELGWDEGRRQAERRALAGFYEAAYNGKRAP